MSELFDKSIRTLELPRVLQLLSEQAVSAEAKERALRVRPETEAEEDGAPNEISFYMGENYRIKNVNFRRWTVRLDGFFSWYAPYRGGEILTKPITVDGSELHLNFATSALGGVKVILCDEDGNELEGYRSYTMFGNSVDRPVEFEKTLSDISGRKVRLKIRMKDAHLYSFVFL